VFTDFTFLSHQFFIITLSQVLGRKWYEMKNKKAKFWVFTAIALISVLLIGAGALFAESDVLSKDEDSSKTPIRERITGFFQSGERTFNDLTDDEKEDLYSAMDDVRKAKDILLDKQVELGLVDSKLAEEMKERSQERFEEAKENGEPFMGRLAGRKMAGMSRLTRSQKRDSGCR